jgi:hypothetical protein
MIAAQALRFDAIGREIYFLVITTDLFTKYLQNHSFISYKPQTFQQRIGRQLAKKVVAKVR